MALAAALGSPGPASAGPVTLVPQPKVVRFAGPAVELSPGSVAIVLGDKASEPEQYAAETLQATVERRCGQQLPILRESSDLKPYKTRIVLGQSSTSKLVDAYSRRLKLDLREKSPGLDAYYIRVFENSGRIIALVAGTNPRSVIYGQDTLYQLLAKTDGKLRLYRADVDDWASIPWRGRPQSSNPLHLIPGRMDSYARARFNFIDLRDGPAGRGGQYGYPPGWKIDVDQVKAIVKEADRRGIFVYATVDCAARPSDFDGAIKTFEELIALGADGLYISVDDPGAEFRLGTPDELIKRVLALGRKHGMTGWKIAIVPGKESYPKILTDVNRRVAKIPGMNEALWFWTVTPSEQAVKDARSIGVKTKPAWWHNWPRPEAGITYPAGGGGTRRANGRSYMEPPTLAGGWGNASYEQLAGAGKWLEAVMPWGGGGWGAEYNSGILGWWAWAPELHDWNAVRTRIYDLVFGPGQVRAAFDFDDTLTKLRQLFKPSEAGWPPILKSTGTRADASKLLDEMRESLKQLTANSEKETLISSETLHEFYLEPMQGTVDAASAILQLDFPDFWWPAHEQRVLTAVRVGNYDQAAAWQREAAGRATAEAARIRDALKSVYSGMDDYVAWWRARFKPIPAIPKVAAGPKIDGDLSDPIWRQALRMPEFRLLGGGEPLDQTEVRVLFTDTDLYVGYTCFEQRMDSLQVVHTARDSDVWMDDSIEIFLNPDVLGETLFQIAVNADGCVMDGRQGSLDWNAALELKTVRGADRWTMEIRIPFEDLGVARNPAGSIWLANFARNDHAGPFSGFESDNPCDISCWSGRGGFHHRSSLLPLQFGE